MWGGVPAKDMVHEPLPLWLETLCARLSEKDVYLRKGEREKGRDGRPRMPNHALINRYEPGQGIMPHTDGPLYFPVVAILSLGSNTVMSFYQDTFAAKKDEAVGRIYLERGSLLLFSDAIYSDYLHSISEDTSDDTAGVEYINSHLLSKDLPSGAVPRGTRYSLTIRVVPDQD